MWDEYDSVHQKYLEIGKLTFRGPLLLCKLLYQNDKNRKSARNTFKRHANRMFLWGEGGIRGVLDPSNHALISRADGPMKMSFHRLSGVVRGRLQYR